MACIWYPIPLGSSYRSCPRAGRPQADTLVPAWARRLARQATIALTGGVAIAAGLVMLVLPGPGLVTIALGFGILGREFAWATRVNGRVRDRVVAAGRTLASRR